MFTNQLVAALSPIRPVTVTMFAGAIDTGKLNFAERSLAWLLKVPTGDFRDWDAIRAWTKDLPGKLGV